MRLGKFKFSQCKRRYAAEKRGVAGWQPTLQSNFMKTIRHTKITIEKRELKFVRTSGNVRHYCRSCLTETEHLPIAQMAVWLMISERRLFRLAEFEMIHSTETTDGRLLICEYSAVNFEK